jgi:hypothetical protein
MAVEIRWRGACRSKWSRLAALVIILGCERAPEETGIGLYPPFNQRDAIVVLYPSVTRSTVSGETQSEIVIDMVNHLQDPAYVRLRGLRLRAADGSISTIETKLSCRAVSGETGRVVREVLASGELIEGSEPVEVDAEVIPLGLPGRAIYREWAWLRRPHEVEKIDAELAAYDALPECRSVAAVGVTPGRAANSK